MVLIFVVLCMTSMLYGAESEKPIELKLLVFNREFFGQLTHLRNTNAFLTEKLSLPVPGKDDCLEDYGDFQCGLHQLKKKYDIQLKKPRQKMTPLQINRLKDFAAVTLARKKLKHEAQYNHIGDLPDNKKKKYFKNFCIPCYFPAYTPDDPEIVRYFVRKCDGGNAVYMDYYRRNDLPEIVAAEMERQRDCGGRSGYVEFEYEKTKQKVCIDYYIASDKSIRAFTRMLAKWESANLLALCNPKAFINVMQNVITSMSDMLKIEAMIKRPAEERRKKLKEFVEAKKEQEIFEDIIARDGEEVFFERLLYRNVLEEQISPLEERTKDGSFIEIDDEHEELYAIKNKKIYYLFGVKLDRSDPDADIVLRAGNTWYGFTEELASIKEGYSLNPQHLSPS